MADIEEIEQMEKGETPVQRWARLLPCFIRGIRLGNLDWDLVDASLANQNSDLLESMKRYYQIKIGEVNAEEGELGNLFRAILSADDDTLEQVDSIIRQQLLAPVIHEV